MAILPNPISSALGATVAGSSGAISGATYGASQLAKVGRALAGSTGEVSGAVFGAGVGSMAGFFVGSLIGALTGQRSVDYYVGDLLGARRVGGVGGGDRPGLTAGSGEPGVLEAGATSGQALSFKTGQSQFGAGAPRRDDPRGGRRG